MFSSPCAPYIPAEYHRKGAGRGRFDRFTSNRSHVVRLPKTVAFPEDVDQVDILKIGHGQVIVPQAKGGMPLS